MIKFCKSVNLKNCLPDHFYLSFFNLSNHVSWENKYDLAIEFNIVFSQQFADHFDPSSVMLFFLIYPESF